MADDMGSKVLADAKGEEIIKKWIEKNVGGKVVRMERQGRWRPAWFVDVEKDGSVKELFVRGERAQIDFIMNNVEREYKIHVLLEKGGIKVAHVYGFIPEIPAMVMDKVRGQGGNLRSLSKESDRESVRKQLAQQMAKMHALDIKPFMDMGFKLPATPRDIAMSYFDDVCAFYRKKKRSPDPRIEFQIAWANRNVPAIDRPACYTPCDAGQFMVDGPELTAMIDFELSMLGDPMNDLAALRIRGQWESVGDIPSLYRMYEEASGTKVNLDEIRFQTLLFGAAGAITTVIFVDGYVQKPTNDADFFEYLTWIHWEHKQGLEAIAELAGYDLPELKIPEPVTTFAHEPLFGINVTIKNMDDSNPFTAYQKRTMGFLTEYMQRVASYGAAFEEEYISGAAKILGRRPKDILEADALLDAYIQKAGPEDDERLFRLIHTDVSRRCFLLATPSSMYHDGLIKPLLPIY